MVQLLWKTVLQFFKMLSIKLLYYLAVLLQAFMQEYENTCLHKNLHMQVHSSIIYNSSKVEATPMSIS